MMFFNLISVFLSFLIAAAIQISFVLADLSSNDTIEAVSSFVTANTPNGDLRPVVNITTGPVDLVTSALPNGENNNGEQKRNSLADSTTLLRTFYVLLAVTAIIIVYFVVRTVRMRMRKNRKTRYGLLSTHDDGLEMRHLEEDEEDATVFDRALSHSRR